LASVIGKTHTPRGTTLARAPRARGFRFQAGAARVIKKRKSRKSFSESVLLQRASNQAATTCRQDWRASVLDLCTLQGSRRSGLVGRKSYEHGRGESLATADAAASAPCPHSFCERWTFLYREGHAASREPDAAHPPRFKAALGRGMLVMLHV